MRRPVGHPPRLATLVVGALLGLAGCGDDAAAPATTSSSGSPATTTTTAAPTTTSTATSTTVPVGADRLARLWFVDGDRLTPVYRVVPGPESAVLALLSEPDPGSGAATAIPAGTELRSYRREGGTAIVDVSAAFTGGGGTLSMQLRLGQVVATALEEPGVDTVELRVEGAVLDVLGGEGLVLDQPLGPADVDPVRPLVVLDEPRPGAVVTGRIDLRGAASVFENVVAVEVRADDGTLLHDGMVMAEGAAFDDQGDPTWAPFATTIEVDPGTARTGVVTVFERSAKDGSPINVLPVPVRFDASAPFLTVVTPDLLPTAA